MNESNIFGVSKFCSQVVYLTLTQTGSMLVALRSSKSGERVTHVHAVVWCNVKYETNDKRNRTNVGPDVVWSPGGRERE